MAQVTYRKESRDTVTSHELSQNSRDKSAMKLKKNKKSERPVKATVKPVAVSTSKPLESNVFRRFEMYRQGSDVPGLSSIDKPVLHDSKMTSWKQRFLRFDGETQTLTMFSSHLTMAPVWKCHVNRLLSYRSLSDTIEEQLEYEHRNNSSANPSIGSRLKLIAENSFNHVKFGNIKSTILVLRISERSASGYEELFLACQSQEELDQWSMLFDKLLSQRWLSHIRNSIRITPKTVDHYMVSGRSSFASRQSESSISTITEKEPSDIPFKKPEPAVRRQKPIPSRIQTQNLPIVLKSKPKTQEANRKVSSNHLNSSPMPATPLLESSPMLSPRFSARLSQNLFKSRIFVRKLSLASIAEHPESEESPISVIDAYSKIETKDSAPRNRRTMKHVDAALLNLCAGNNQAHFMLSILQIQREIQETITVWREEISIESDLVTGHNAVTTLVNSCSKSLNELMPVLKETPSFNSAVLPKIVDIRSAMSELLVTVAQIDNPASSNNNISSVFEHSETVVRYLVAVRQSFETLRNSCQSII